MFKHVLLGGKVQGVGYRRFVQKRAVQNAVQGWVRNLTSGMLECFMFGEQDSLERFEVYLLRGPEGSAPRDAQTLNSGQQHEPEFLKLLQASEVFKTSNEGIFFILPDANEPFFIK